MHNHLITYSPIAQPAIRAQTSSLNNLQARSLSGTELALPPSTPSDMMHLETYIPTTGCPNEQVHSGFYSPSAPIDLNTGESTIPGEPKINPGSIFGKFAPPTECPELAELFRKNRKELTSELSTRHSGIEAILESWGSKIDLYRDKEPPVMHPQEERRLELLMSMMMQSLATSILKKHGAPMLEQIMTEYNRMRTGDDPIIRVTDVAESGEDVIGEKDVGREDIKAEYPTGYVGSEGAAGETGFVEHRVRQESSRDDCDSGGDASADEIGEVDNREGTLTADKPVPWGVTSVADDLVWVEALKASLHRTADVLRRIKGGQPPPSRATDEPVCCPSLPSGRTLRTKTSSIDRGATVPSHFRHSPSEPDVAELATGRSDSCFDPVPAEDPHLMALATKNEFDLAWLIETRYRKDASAQMRDWLSSFGTASMAKRTCAAYHLTELIGKDMWASAQLTESARRDERQSPADRLGDMLAQVNEAGWAPEGCAACRSTEQCLETTGEMLQELNADFAQETGETEQDPNPAPRMADQHEEQGGAKRPAEHTTTQRTEGSVFTGSPRSHADPRNGDPLQTGILQEESEADFEERGESGGSDDSQMGRNDPGPSIASTFTSLPPWMAGLGLGAAAAASLALWKYWPTTEEAGDA
ncbi:uncharacterized protein MKK02DRAFT_38315 [Dioszegia hungarica]|uniref:Uncharacterized protein n=1 Tax=Dioszegia hungarica TaxID=4972 RepID=A0AA38H686_9TREE|nr:uncharacterized protein MKK02DRAFT_38315 [Dioszegia hungarica]KAI9633656.1 hypothetical protein MKK02DRAFT_38315 [Dioszegia hungarica]